MVLWDFLILFVCENKLSNAFWVRQCRKNRYDSAIVIFDGNVALIQNYLMRVYYTGRNPFSISILGWIATTNRDIPQFVLALCAQRLTAFNSAI
jgi:hypothetical protein